MLCGNVRNSNAGNKTSLDTCEPKMSLLLSKITYDLTKSINNYEKFNVGLLQPIQNNALNIPINTHKNLLISTSLGFCVRYNFHDRLP